jgi:hypothetical protein
MTFDTAHTFKRHIVYTREQVDYVVRAYRRTHSVYSYRVEHPNLAAGFGGYILTVVINYHHKYRIEKECYDEVLPAPTNAQWNYIRCRCCHRPTSD